MHRLYLADAGRPGLAPDQARVRSGRDDFGVHTAAIVADLDRSEGQPDQFRLAHIVPHARRLASARLAVLLARPEGAETARLWHLAAVAVVTLGLLLWAYVTTPAEARQMATVGKTMTTCLVTIPLLSVLPVAVLHYTLRQGSVTAPLRAGFVAGLAGAGLSAAVSALHYTEDSPLFHVTWYRLAIAGITLVSTLIGARNLRW
jgi:hypothetical protein